MMLLAREPFFASFRLRFNVFLIPEEVSETKTLGTLISSRLCPFTIQRFLHDLPSQHKVKTCFETCSNPCQQNTSFRQKSSRLHSACLVYFAETIENQHFEADHFALEKKHQAIMHTTNLCLSFWSASNLAALPALPSASYLTRDQRCFHQHRSFRMCGSCRWNLHQNDSKSLIKTGEFYTPNTFV